MSTPENPYTVRRAAAADVPAVLDMKLDAWREAYGDLRPEAFFRAERDRRGQLIDWWNRGLAAGAEFWLAEDAAGRVVGCAGATPGLDEDSDAGVGVELQILYVLAEAYGTGLGLRLMRAAIGELPALVWVLRENPRAQAFYRKHGFAPDGTTEALDGLWEGLTEIRMVRRG